MTFKTTKSRAKHQTIKLQPFENLIDYQTMIDFQVNGREVGVYLLKKNSKSPFKLVFGFECPGIHSFLSTEDNSKVLQKLIYGLPNFPYGERATFHLGAYKNDFLRQQQLQKIYESAPSDEIRFLTMGDKLKVNQLSQAGLREPKTLHIFVTYELNKISRNRYWLESTKEKLEKLWQKSKGKFSLQQRRNLRRSLYQAWKYGLINWEQILVNQLGLKVTPMSPEQMWDYLNGRVSSRPISEIPQKVMVNTKTGELQEQINTPMHAASMMVVGGEPRFEREYVKVGDEYIGVLTFWQKPGGWNTNCEQLHYFWNLVAQDIVTDTEIITQIVPAHQRSMQQTMNLLTKQSKGQTKISERNNNVDVSAEMTLASSKQAQEEILKGNVPFYVATVILVKRKSVFDLEEACQYIENSFQRPALVVRDRQIAWKRWLNSLPVLDRNLLGTFPLGHRMPYLATEVPAFLPLVKSHSIDSEGLELIGEDGGTPIHLDLFSEDPNKHRHVAVFGTTRSGKSVLVSGILTDALSRRVPCVVIDYPKPDGTSTYTTYTHFMESRGAYFNVGKECINLFDRPNLDFLPPDEQKQRFEDYKDFLSNCLLVMAIGESHDELLNLTARTILYKTLNSFFSNTEIVEQYRQAEAGGIGSQAWQNMPTLKTFLIHFRDLAQKNQLNKLSGEATIDDSNILMTQSLIKRAIELINLRLSYWTESRVGEAISSPSTVKTDAPLMVLALTQVSQNEDAAILSLVAYAAALRRAVEHPISLFFIDESPILFKFPSIVKLVASLISNGAKSGIKVVLSSQDPNTIAQCEAGQQIYQNIATRIIGRITKPAVKAFHNVLDYEFQLVERCHRFRLDKNLHIDKNLHTKWLLDDQGIITYCRYYPAPVLLALVANNKVEEAIRQRFLDFYSDKYQAIAEFAKVLEESFLSHRNLRTVTDEYFDRLEPTTDLNSKILTEKISA